MRALVLAGTAIGLVAATPALAANCQRPPEPFIPDPATAREGQMLMAGQSVKFYFENMTRYSRCLAAEAADATAEAGTVEEKWKKAVGEFNARVKQ
ncbi:MAG: hypothetical protein ABI399_06725 [Bauldia sp.]